MLKPICNYCKSFTKKKCLDTGTKVIDIQKACNKFVLQSYFHCPKTQQTMHIEICIHRTKTRYGCKGCKLGKFIRKHAGVAQVEEQLASS